MSGAKKRIVELTRSGKYANMRCVADAAGVTRERVRQVLNESEEFDGFGPRAGFRMEWPCPDCGVQISLKRSELRKIVHQPAVCRECAKDWCKSSRHRFSQVGRVHGGCKPCHLEWRDEVVEVRTCQHCERPLNITRNYQNVMRSSSHRARGKYHRECYNEILRGERRSQNAQPCPNQ